MTTIIGGGGAGLYYACLAKEKDPEQDITIIEEHTDIGKPVQCTGILTDEIEKLIPPTTLKKITMNKITRTEVFSPNNSTTLPLKTNYIIDNVAFTYYLAERAEKAGVKLMTGFRYTENRGETIKLRNTSSKEILEIKSNKIIGADGPASPVAKANNLYNKEREFLTGVQARIKLNKLEEDKIDFYPYIGEYAWSTPEGNNVSRIGVAAKSNAKKIFDDFIKKYSGKTVEMQGGPIPLHKPGLKLRFARNNFSATLLGDAALQIKNTTGGGIIPGMKAAKILAEDFDNYEKNLRSLNRELKLHYLINRALAKYDERDWDRLIEKVKTPSIKAILASTNRDNALKMALQLSTRPAIITEGIRAFRKLILS
jgi:digeranylgeranylglycerophospholipid reductase